MSEWKLVPVNPTAGMIDAAYETVLTQGELLSSEAYHAMLAAAPVPTAAGEWRGWAMLLTPPEDAESLRARLGMRDDGGPDGITCRDETIRLQDEMIERLRAAQEKK